MLTDSHCHFNLIDLDSYDGGVGEIIENANSMGVDRFLCVAVNRRDFDSMVALTESYDNVWFSAGVHPNDQHEEEATIESLLSQAAHPRVIAIGETGLDYFRSSGELEWQRDRFRLHVQAAKKCGKPLIIHSRDAKEDTIRILDEEGAKEVRGVMHCFTGDWEMAQQALALDFYISFSGIVTFKSATVLQDVATRMPLDRMLVETDCPYLAPVPNRGKPNQPAWVRHTAEFIAELRGQSFEEIADATTGNFRELFSV